MRAETSSTSTAAASRPTKKVKVEGDEGVVLDEVGGGSYDDGTGGVIGDGVGGMGAIGTAAGIVLGEASPFSEEELKTLGSGDDEDIPAARRAAMASAVALRAAAGGSPVEPPKSAS
jgi:hypothetical protein